MSATSNKVENTTDVDLEIDSLQRELEEIVNVKIPSKEAELYQEENDTGMYYSLSVEARIDGDLVEARRLEERVELGESLISRYEQDLTNLKFRESYLRQELVRLRNERNNASEGPPYDPNWSPPKPPPQVNTTSNAPPVSNSPPKEPKKQDTTNINPKVEVTNTPPEFDLIITEEDILEYDREQTKKEKEAKLETSKESKTSYNPKKEPNNKNQKPESKKDLSLKDYAKQQGYESDQKEVDLLLKDAEQDLKNRQEKEKHRERIQNQIERDILLSIVNDQKDVLTYLNLIDETYSSKNNSVIGVLENLKRKQGKRNPVFDKKAPKNTLDIFGGPKYKARESTQPNIITRPDSFEDEVKKLKDNINKPIKLLRQTDQIDQSAPKIKTVQVAYEDSTRPNGKKIPVLKIEET